MTAKTVLNIHPKVFAAIAAGAGFAILTALATHLEPSLFNFLPAEYRGAATTLAGTAVSGLAGYLKTVSADETPAEQAVSTDIAKVVEDATAGMASTANPASATA